MSDVFFSYARRDAGSAARLEADLIAAGLSVWRDSRIRPGETFSDEIAAAIESCRAVVWLASNQSIESPWVRRELEFATDCKKVLIPVYLDEESIQKLPGGVKLLFPHAQHVVMDERHWHERVRQIVAAIRQRMASPTPEQAPPARRPPHSTGVEFSPGPYQEWPDGLGAVGPPPPIELLPIDEETPMIVGTAIDVSGSMQTALQNDSEEQKSRLEGVLEGVRELASRYHRRGHSAEIEQAMPLFRLFALGFGFAARAAKYGKLGAVARRFYKDLPPLPATIYQDPVRDLLAMAGLGSRAVSPADIDARWEQIHTAVWDQRIDLFGSTPMCEGLKNVEARFLEEFRHYRGSPYSALFLVSDGESKDGSPIEACRSIAALGTIIFSCYLTSEDIAPAKQLYDRPQPGWQPGAITLFRCSSVLDEDSILIPPLREKGWAVHEGDRLFLQLNHSSHVSEFMSMILELIRGDRGDKRGTPISRPESSA